MEITRNFQIIKLSGVRGLFYNVLGSILGSIILTEYSLKALCGVLWRWLNSRLNQLKRSKTALFKGMQKGWGWVGVGVRIRLSAHCKSLQTLSDYKHLENIMQIPVDSSSSIQVLDNFNK